MTRPEESTPVSPVETYLFADDGAVPNSLLPLLIHRAALSAGPAGLASALERLFARNGWTGSWRNGIFDYHHYHSTAHEVLGVAAGSAAVRFGGRNGRDLTLAAGDVAVLPAGTGHRRVRADSGLLVVGAYPEGSGCDLIRAEPGEIERARSRIAQVPLPKADPVAGPDGPAVTLWREAAR